jgi:DNA-binding NarL/FixJ family response regulator
MLDALLIKEISKLHQKPAIVVISPDEPDCLSSLAVRGIRGVVLTTSGRGELLAAIRVAASGNTYIDSHIDTIGISGSSTPSQSALTRREREVLYWIARGLDNMAISKRMVLSEKTVKNHISHLLSKLGKGNRTQAAAEAWMRGYTQIPPDMLPAFLKYRAFP